MEDLIHRLQQDALTARKTGNKVASALLVTLNSEIANVGKNAGNRRTTPDEAIRTIKKFVTNLDDSLAVIQDAARRNILLEEKAILSQYLPTNASDEAVQSYALELIASLPEKTPKAMGTVMAGLKTRFGEQFDAKATSTFVRTALST